MTPTDEATFIALWEQGLPGDAIAARLGIPPGTVKSRAHALQQQGKIQPRPRGAGGCAQPVQHRHRDQCSG
jgi:DNA-directed RNA polymerase specialized sigma24 family protein